MSGPRGMLAVAVAVAALGGCTVGDTDDRHAVATLESRSGSTVTGVAHFVPDGELVELTLTVAGATPGQHGVHLHAVGDCSAPDATSAMGHWNPTEAMHGDHGSPVHHLGDCGNLTVAADGTGTLVVASAWTIGSGLADDIAGKALIVHELPDDGVTQMPPGNAGARQACGVVTVSAE
jgi:superoxide dismutase, Cu-Zn family